MTAEELKEFKPWYNRTRKTVTINIDNRAIAYFKGLANETGVPYQTLMNLYLVQCSEEKKRPVFV
ncbi:MAG: antitoxin [Lachnospiraceae bacterium]|nr:antitoxin [Lachnospiraceae bacterium]